MNGNLACGLVRSAAAEPGRIALKLDDVELTYAMLEELSARMAGFLRSRGVGPGDRVGVMLPNGPWFAVSYYGVLRAGAVVVPMNILLKQRELGFHLKDAGAQLLIAWQEIAEVAREASAEVGCECVLASPGGLERFLETSDAAGVAEVEDSDTAVILYTSGTTGTPKGAELTHVNLTHNLELAQGLFGLNERSVILGALPLFHTFGQTCTLNATIAIGAELTLLARFDAGKALEVMQRDGVTVFAGVPTMYGALLHHPERERFDTTKLELCVSGGAPLPVELMRSFEQAFGCPIVEGYGLSETSPIASFNRRDRERKPGSVGTPVDDVEMKIVDDNDVELPTGEVGEIVIRGANVMKGYWRRPEETAEAISPDGWFHSGDMAYVDEDGYFFIVDRKKDMILRGGFNVYPREIEEVLYEHPAVREAAVIGIPHPELGEEVGAVIALKPDTNVAAHELRDFVKERLAAYKYPRHVWFVDELPKTATGKILKREIERPSVVTES